MIDPGGIANRSVTYVDWSEFKWHPKSFRAQDITFEFLKNLTSIDDSVHYTSDPKLRLDYSLELKDSGTDLEVVSPFIFQDLSHSPLFSLFRGGSQLTGVIKLHFYKCSCRRPFPSFSLFPISVSILFSASSLIPLPLVDIVESHKQNPVKLSSESVESFPSFKVTLRPREAILGFLDRIEERTGKYGTPRLQYLQELVSQFQNSTDEETKEKIAANLANFAYDPYNYSFLRQLNVLELFLDCMTEPNEKLVEFGVGGVCNSSVDPANAAIIVRCGGIPLVIECLSSPVRNTVNYALGALYYLCNKSNREEILKPEVVDLIKRYAAAQTVNLSSLSPLNGVMHGNLNGKKAGAIEVAAITKITLLGMKL
ncbi:Armadillo [Corchorus olitorius]|uniref:Armadillo n=1 Tax=Corchorus olitorius TaxID=93759 RepID=A0A1R3J8K2_9ROSI|nr:Armadillo [Corchorus olitorius]